MKLISIFLLFISIGFSARASSTPPDTTFIRKALTAIKNQDIETLEGLRDEITDKDVAELVEIWSPDLAWEVKSGFVDVLMDQSGEIVFELMTDALNAPAVETRAYALICVTGDFSQFEKLMDSSGWLNEKKVDEAILKYQKSKK
jgi:hypothetical protein